MGFTHLVNIFEDQVGFPKLIARFFTHLLDWKNTKEASLI